MSAARPPASDTLASGCGGVVLEQLARRLRPASSAISVMRSHSAGASAARRARGQRPRRAAGRTRCRARGGARRAARTPARCRSPCSTRARSCRRAARPGCGSRAAAARRRQARPVGQQLPEHRLLGRGQRRARGRRSARSARRAHLHRRLERLQALEELGDAEGGECRRPRELQHATGASLLLAGRRRSTAASGTA